MLGSVLFILALATGCHSKALSFNGDGGIDNLLVVLDDASKEDDLSHTISNDIAIFFHEVSRVLHTATKGHSYFREIQILIPRSWSNKPEYQVAGEQSMKQADMIVAEANPAHGEQPYVLQPGECGDSGRFIHITPDFLKNGINAVRDQSIAAKTVVQQWIKYRYGVYDESVPYPKTPEEAVTCKYRPFYPKGDENNFTFIPTVCGELDGHSEMEDGSQCHVDTRNNWIDHRCRFNPDPKQHINSSLMYSAELGDLVELCEDSGPNKHNIYALNEHNDRCDYRSVWAILNQHSDFKYHHETITQVPVPKISFYKPGDQQRIIYVLDTSSSMVGCGLETMVKATKVAINSLPLPVDLGIVTFNDRGKEETLLPMTLIKTPQEIKKVLAKLPTDASTGETCIHCGADKALQELKTRETRGAQMVLLTDGKENLKPDIVSLIPDLKTAGVLVHTVAIGTNASSDLTKVAIETGGIAQSVNALCSDTGFPKSMLEPTLSPYAAIVHYSEKKDHIIHGTFYIDADLGHNTRILVLYSISTGINVDFKSPSGIEFTITQPEGPRYEIVYEETKVPGLTISKENGLYVLRFGDIEKGTWKYSIRKSKDAPGEIEAIIVAISERYGVRHPIFLDAYVSSLPLDLNVANRLVVYASVFRGLTPLTFGQVFEYDVRATYDGGELVLRDNGRGADSHENDGVYSAYFTDFPKCTDEKRISLEVTAEMELLHEGSIHRSKRILISVINCQNPKPPSPPRINDFCFTAFNNRTREATFEWTAPEEVRAHFGQMKAYELVVASKQEDLVPNVSDSEEIQDKILELTYDSHKITPHGLIDNVVITIDSVPTGLIFARIRAFNGNGLAGPWSNLALSLIITEPIPPPPPPPQPNTTTETSTMTTEEITTTATEITTTEETTTTTTTTTTETTPIETTTTETTTTTTATPPEPDVFLDPRLIQHGKVIFKPDFREHMDEIVHSTDCSEPTGPVNLPRRLLYHYLQKTAQVKFEVPLDEYIKLVKSETCWNPIDTIFPLPYDYE